MQVVSGGGFWCVFLMISELGSPKNSNSSVSDHDTGGGG